MDKIVQFHIFNGIYLIALDCNGRFFRATLSDSNELDWWGFDEFFEKPLEVSP